MSRNDFTDQNIFKKIETLKNAGNAPLVDSENFSEVKINIRQNKTISPGKFKKDPLIPNGWLAHPVTIKAMRTELFMVGEGFLDLESPYTCRCGEKLDKQFWKFCPHCEASFDT